MKLHAVFLLGAGAVAGLANVNTPTQPPQAAATADQCMDILINAAPYLPPSTSGTYDLSASPEAKAVDNKYKRCMLLAGHPAQSPS